MLFGPRGTKSLTDQYPRVTMNGVLIEKVSHAKFWVFLLMTN